MAKKEFVRVMIETDECPISYWECLDTDCQESKKGRSSGKRNREEAREHCIRTGHSTNFVKGEEERFWREHEIEAAEPAPKSITISAIYDDDLKNVEFLLIDENGDSLDIPLHDGVVQQILERLRGRE